MSLQQILKQSLGDVWRYRRILLVLYVLVLATAVFVVWPFQALLQGTVGHSLRLSDLVKGWDYSFWVDFTNAFKGSLTPIFNLSLLAILVFVLLLIFLLGGILSTFKNAPKPIHPGLLWGKSAAFFWRMLRVSVYFLLMHGLLLLLLGFLFMQFTNGLSPIHLESDARIATVFRLLVPVYILLAAALLMWGDYAKVFLVNLDTRWVFRPIWESLRFVLCHFWKAYALYLILLGMLGLVSVLSWQLFPLIEERTVGLICLSFLLSQILLLLRLFLRLWQWRSAGIFSNVQ